MRALVLLIITLSVMSFAQQPAEPVPIRVAGGIMAGRLLTKVQPVFPWITKDQRVSGSIVMHAIIGRDGTIHSLQVIRCPEILRANTVDAVKQWTYKPYVVNGAAVPVDTTITLNIDF